MSYFIASILSKYSSSSHMSCWWGRYCENKSNVYFWWGKVLVWKLIAPMWCLRSSQWCTWKFKYPGFVRPCWHGVTTPEDLNLHTTPVPPCYCTYSSRIGVDILFYLRVKAYSFKRKSLQPPHGILHTCHQILTRQIGKLWMYIQITVVISAVNESTPI